MFLGQEQNRKCAVNCNGKLSYMYFHHFFFSLETKKIDWPFETRNKTNKSDWLLNSFPHRKTEKVELDSTFIWTERKGKFSVWKRSAHAHKLFRSVPTDPTEHFLEVEIRL